MKRILSPVLFISGPSCLLTLGNLLNEKTGCFIAYPSNLGSNLKSFSLFFLALLWWHN